MLFRIPNEPACAKGRPTGQTKESSGAFLWKNKNGSAVWRIWERMLRRGGFRSHGWSCSKRAKQAVDAVRKICRKRHFVEKPHKGKEDRKFAFHKRIGCLGTNREDVRIYKRSKILHKVGFVASKNGTFAKNIV